MSRKRAFVGSVMSYTAMARFERALQADEGERAALDARQSHALGLDALVVAAAVVVDTKADGFAVELAAAVENNLAVGIADRERVGAELHERPAAHGVDVRQRRPAEFTAVWHVLHTEAFPAEPRRSSSLSPLGLSRASPSLAITR